MTAKPVHMVPGRRTLAALALGAAAIATGAGPAPTPASAAPTGTTCIESASTPIPQPTAARMAAAGLGGLPVAPEARRVDLVAPRFSNPTKVTNPLFPIADLRSVVLNGTVDRQAFRTETTLLSETRTVEWSPGQCVKTLVSQYVAYVDGRIEEVALDLYAQADDGSVWYFGEDVYNYDDGAIADTAGTWLAGKEGPAAMIMPAAPTPGDVNRPENIPGLVWEEVAVKRMGETVDGPRGPVAGAMVGAELHDDGSFSDKVFAPGYGEFFTAHGGDIEALALAVPTDALPGGVPKALRRLSVGARAVLRTAGSKRWAQASSHVRRTAAAWRDQRAAGVPPRLARPARRALTSLDRAVQARDRAKARHAALDVLQAALDLELQYRPTAAVDRARFDLWARQVLVDAETRDLPALSGDTAVLEWIRDRIASSLDAVDLTRLDTRLEELRARVADAKPAAAARAAAALRTALAGARTARR